MSKQIHERTAFRLAMLANGFQPLLNDCKRPIEKGWPQRTVDAAEVRSWDRSALLSTGMKIDGDLAAIDADIADASLVEPLADALGKRFPALFEYGLVRHAGGPKEAWFARVDEPFRRLASRRWYRGEDPDDPAVPKHLVECFGRSGRGSSPSTGRTRGARPARSSTLTSLPAAPRRRRCRAPPYRCCRRRPTRRPATCLTRSPPRQGSPCSRSAGMPTARRHCACSNSTPIPRSRRTTTAR